MEPQFYEVEKILSKRTYRGEIQYRIKWKGWNRPQDLTWEPKENLEFVQDMINEFELKESSKKQKNLRAETQSNRSSLSGRIRLTKLRDRGKKSSSSSDGDASEEESGRSRSRSGKKVDASSDSSQQPKKGRKAKKIKRTYKKKESSSSPLPQQQPAIKEQESDNEVETIQLVRVNHYFYKDEKILLDCDLTRNGKKTFPNEFTLEEAMEMSQTVVSQYFIQFFTTWVEPPMNMAQIVMLGKAIAQQGQSQ